jgi:hypothetical protein
MNSQKLSKQPEPPLLEFSLGHVEGAKRFYVDEFGYRLSQL